MHQPKLVRCLCFSICIATFLTIGLHESSETVAADETKPLRYNRDVLPILSDRCFHCHGPNEEDRQANLRLDMSDGNEGAYRNESGLPAISPGKPDESEVWLRLNTDDPDMAMPPADSHKEPLSDEEKQIIRQWIEQGAQYESFWAFVSPEMPDIAAPNGSDTSAIDVLVHRQLREANLSPSPPADKRTLIRRVTFDLTGLPPSPAEIQNFLADDSPDAFEKVVDRLLESPHYGEHVARYWLDLVRFADTNGIHHDHYRDLSPYRDWVIRAFNQNLPYDDFVRYQLAGDLYESPTTDQLIASGFHRLHLIIDRGTMLPEESFTRNVLDRVTSVGTAFMGLTMQCAVCHDHKYDPITMQDFYSLSAFFNNIDADPETGGRSGTDFVRGLQPPYINLASAEQETKLAEFDATLEQLDQEIQTTKAKLQEAQSQENSSDEQKAPLQDALKQLEQNRQSQAKARDDYLTEIPAAMIMKERTEIRPAHVLIRGAYDNPGKEVSRNSPGFLPAMKSTGDTKNRLDLANWFVDPQHPLTARVAVNRFWQQLFGVGIVRTSEDFGAQGEWPSHPELLDYLAVRFQESGWDVKELFKEIVMSATYQQSSFASPEQFKRDPQNRLLARGSRFRMDSEMIRDQILATSGLLNTSLFGKSVKPPQPDGLWKAVSMPSSYPKEFQADTGEKIYRRSVYTFWKRGMPPPQMTILNAPSREECIARRERTNTPLQALLLLNEAEYLKAARQLAARVLAESDSSAAEYVDALYEIITSQQASESQRQAFVQLQADLAATYAQNPDLAQQLCPDQATPREMNRSEWAAWTMVASAIYNLDVTKTRQ
ncbi:MAG: PSD1 and planctomycete cytochrome C domain-containing protein [Pirellulaceae bacterium]